MIDVKTERVYNVLAEVNGRAGFLLPFHNHISNRWQSASYQGSGNRPPFASATIGPDSWRFVVSGRCVVNDPHEMEMEADYRRGYYDGVEAAVEAMKGGITYRQVESYMYDSLCRWRDGEPDNFVDACCNPPSLPEPWVKIKNRILARDNHVCRYCGNPATTVDHIVPLSRGGSESPDNLTAACADCNRRKHNKLLSEWTPKRKRRG